ncbi:unnamed protein product [Victoria cruziana]
MVGGWPAANQDPNGRSESRKWVASLYVGRRSDPYHVSVDLRPKCMEGFCYLGGMLSLQVHGAIAPPGPTPPSAS